jgi:hypothetical protein
MSRSSKPSRTDADKGLIDLFGHTYIANPDRSGEKTIQYQFQIIRKMDGERYVVQLFLFLSGDPTSVAIYPESFLLGDDVKLHVTAELWKEAYAKTCR